MNRVDIETFLLLCLRSEDSEQCRLQFNQWLMEQAIDWDEVVNYALVARIGSLLHPLLRSREQVPAPVKRKLYEAYMDMASFHLLLRHELERVAVVLEENGIDTLLLKGLALSATIYRPTQLRSLGDIDLLIRRSDVAKVTAHLVALGYELVTIPLYEGYTVRYENEMVWQKTINNTTVWLELHWSLFNSPYYQQQLDMGWWWETAVFTKINDHAIKILSPEAQMIYLSAHLWLHHAGEGLWWWYDLMRLLTVYELDWDVVVKASQRQKLILPWQKVIKKLREHWPDLVANVPDTLIDNDLVSEQEKVMFKEWSQIDLPVIRRFWRDIWGVPGWGNRVLFMLMNLFPSITYMRERYRLQSNGIVLFYYPYRWFKELFMFLGVGDKE
ncbi:MAG TPA: nucleotidyltransferase family protein [Anaerolineae bacterium]|nr:nucleotidyltransferase family protein [Anaerolineae bacterium]